MGKSKKEYTNTPKLVNQAKSQLDTNELFLIVNIEDKWRIGLPGRWVTRQIFNSREEAQAYIDQKPWEMIMAVASVMAESMMAVIKEAETKEQQP